MGDNEELFLEYIKNMLCKYIKDKCKEVTMIQRSQLEEYATWTNTEPLASVICEVLGVK